MYDDFFCIPYYLSIFILWVVSFFPRSFFKFVFFGGEKDKGYSLFFELGNFLSGLGGSISYTGILMPGYYLFL